MTVKFNNVYVNNASTIASVYEKDGPIADCFDMVYDTYITVTKEDDLVIGDEVIYGAEGMPTAILSHRIDRVLVVDEYLYYLDYDYLVTKKRKIKV